MNWFQVVKKETKQGKLPESVTQGATISTRPLKDWFKPNRKKPEVPEAEETHPNTKQSTLGDFS